jgi:hypothetical protein
MKWLVLAALAAICLGAFSLVGNTLHLATGVNRLSDEHAAAAGVPRLLNAEAVPVNDGVAIFTVRCESEGGCGGTLTVDLKDKIGAADYALDAGTTRQVGVLLPLDTHARRGTLTWREGSGATADVAFRLEKG